MGSPFKTADEYVNATGTLHSFTGHPTSVAITLGLSVLVTIYFLYKAYHVR